MHRSPRFSSRSFRRPASAGFTLTEMIVVLAIIGLIAGLVVTRVGNVFDKSQESVARLFVRQSMTQPLTVYRLDMGSYPSTSEGLAALVTAPTGAGERWRGPYMEAPGGKLPLDPFGQPYEYRCPGVKNPSGYDLFSRGLDKLPDTADDIGNW